MKQLQLHHRPVRPMMLMMLAVVTLMLGGCDKDSPQTRLESISERGKLRVGTIFGASSYYIDRDGPSGFEYELSKAFADYLGLELEVVPNYHIAQLFPMLQNDQVDLLAGGLTITPERLKDFRFSPSYYQVSQKLVFKQGNKRPRKLADLKDPVVVVAKSSHAETLQAVSGDYPDLQWTQSDDSDADELLEKVASGEIAYTVADSNNLAINRRYFPNLSIGFTVQKEQDIGWIINREDDDSLYAVMIEFFGHMYESGELQVMLDKYFGHVESFNYVDTKLFIEATETKLPKYKAMFKQYAGDIDWRLLAAMSYQESLWNPKAKSHTGVRGLMMMTLPTAKQMGVTNRLDAEQNIQGGSKYLARLIKRIPDRIQMPDRMWFAIASYNIGWGHLEDARVITQRHGGDPDKWIDVKKRLPLLRQKKYYKTTRYGYARGDEPVRYVENIRRYYHSLVWLDERAQSEQKATDYREQLSDALQTQPEATDAPASDAITGAAESVPEQKPEVDEEK